MSAVVVEGIALAIVYAEDYESSLKFYRDTLGLADIQPMNEHSCYISINEEQGMYLVGKFAKVERGPHQTGCSFVLAVANIEDCWNALVAIGAERVQTELVQMNDTTWWFQCYDPSRNIIEFIGPRN